MPRLDPYASTPRGIPPATTAPTRPKLKPPRRWERTPPAQNGERRKFRKIHVDNAKVLLVAPYVLTSVGILVLVYSVMDNLILMLGTALTLVGYGIHMSNTMDLKINAIRSTYLTGCGEEKKIEVPQYDNDMMEQFR